MQDIERMLNEINALSAQAELLAVSIALDAARAAGAAGKAGDPPPEMDVLLEKMRQQAATVDRMARRLASLANAPGREPVQLGGGEALREAGQQLQRTLRERKPPVRVAPAGVARRLPGRV